MKTLDQSEVESFISNQKPDRHRESCRAAADRLVIERNALVAVAEAATAFKVEQRNVITPAADAIGVAIRQLGAIRNPSFPRGRWAHNPADDETPGSSPCAGALGSAENYEAHFQKPGGIFPPDA